MISILPLCALVTGGNSGIGRAISLGLAQAGYQVIILARHSGKNESVVAEIKAKGGRADSYALDVSQPSEVQSIFSQIAERYGAPSLLVNNAGVTRGGRLDHCTPQDWIETIGINLTGTFLCSLEAHRLMKKVKTGHIINIASQAAGWSGAEEIIYGTTKTAQVKFTLHLLDEWKKTESELGCQNPSFFAHAICPGGVDTPWYDSKPWADRSQMLQPEEVAELLCALVEHPTQDLDFWKQWSKNKTFQIGPLGLFEPHPAVLRIWK